MKEKTRKSLKFEKQARLGMGVCMKRKINPDTNEEGELEGVRLPIFDYTGKYIVSISKWNKLVEDEIRYVKSKSRIEAKKKDGLFLACQIVYIAMTMLHF